MQVTNGSITFERNRKTADYEGKKASVTLSFLIPEGEDAEAAAARVGQLAMNRALMMVGETAQEAVVQHFPAHEQPPAPASVPAPKGRRAANPPSASSGDPSAPTQNNPPMTTPAVVASSASGVSAGQPSPLAATAAPATPAAAATGASPQASSVADPRLSVKGMEDVVARAVEKSANRQATILEIKRISTELTGNEAIRMRSIEDLAKRAEFVRRVELL